jgi:hypothetical protein
MEGEKETNWMEGGLVRPTRLKKFNVKLILLYYSLTLE